MRRFYVILGILFAACIAIFIASFIYLDRERHKVYHYILYIDGKEAGTIKIDRFTTEDRIIYKSISKAPFFPIPMESRARIDLDRRYNLKSYSRESRSGNASEDIYLERGDGGLSFVSIFDSQFYCLIDSPVRKDIFVFEEASPLTYLAMIENYDFRKGRSQGFNAVTMLVPELPPIKRYVTFTSIRDERIKVGRRKIKTEELLVKIRNYPQSIMWVSKYDRSLIKLEIPSDGLTILRTFKPKAVKTEPFAAPKDSYITREAVFKSRNAQIAGTFTAPQDAAKSPAVLLIWGDGPQDREYQGIFTSLADYLTRKGFAVLRFDKRGIGSSAGDFSSVTYSLQADDIRAAAEYLASQKEADPSRMAMICYGAGAVYAPMTAPGKNAFRALVLMSPIAFSQNCYGADSSLLKEAAAKYKWSDEYKKAVARSRFQTIEKIKGARRDWIAVLGHRCFVGKMREALNLDPIGAFKNIKMPVSIVGGRLDETASPLSAVLIDRALEEGGNASRAMTYFDKCGHLLAKRINDGTHRMHYQIDALAAETLKNWLESNLSQPPPAEALPPPQDDAKPSQK